MAALAKVYFRDEIRMFELNKRTVEEVSLKIHECFGITREDVDMFFVNEGRPFAIKQTEDLILGLRLVDDDGPVHITLVVKGEYRTMKGEKSVALDCKKRGSQLHNAAEAKQNRLLEEQAMELERQEREQEEEERQRQRQAAVHQAHWPAVDHRGRPHGEPQPAGGPRAAPHRRGQLYPLLLLLLLTLLLHYLDADQIEAERRRLEELARDLEHQGREQEEERQRQETERHRLEELARELEHQGREQEEEIQRQEAERRRLLEEQARERERQEREQEEERQRQEAERRRTEERERQEREQEEKRQRLARASAMTPATFHVHCGGGRAAEVAAALEAARRDPERVRALLEWRGGSNWTPLHRAAYNDHGEVLRLLLEAGADRDARAKDGWTPMHMAAYYGKEAVVRLLLEAGADKNATDNEGETPLAKAQQEGYAAIVELLR